MTIHNFKSQTIKSKQSCVSRWQHMNEMKDDDEQGGPSSVLEQIRKAYASKKVRATRNLFPHIRILHVFSSNIEHRAS